MATHRSVSSFAGAIQRTATAIQRGQRDALMAGAMVMKDHLVDELRRDTGGDLQMRNVGSAKTRGAGGAKVGARFDVKGTMNPTALFHPTGPVALLTSGARPHIMWGRFKRNGRQKRMRLPDGGFRNVVPHPGTKGKRTWHRGREKGTKPTVDRMRKSMVDIVKRGTFG